MEDERSLEKIMLMAKIVSFFLLLMHCYWHCYLMFDRFGLTFEFINRFLLNLQNSTGLFNSPFLTKTICLGFLSIGLLGTRGKKDCKITINQILTRLSIGLGLFFGAGFLLPLLALFNAVALDIIYLILIIAGFLLILQGGTCLSRLLKTNLTDDVFNTENESFMQETRTLHNPAEDIPTVHLPTKFYYKGQWHEGMINVVNPHRATIVLGTPGSGKSFAIIDEYIKQLIEQGNCMYVYDYKFPALSMIAYNHYRLFPHGYKNSGNGIQPKVYFINFDDPRRSHRCNPLNPSFLKDITDANESAHIILMNLNRSWIKKQGDFFVESPKILLAAIIWYLKIYQDGKYCTLPHAIELLNKKYEELFIILSTYPELENYMAPFKEALEGGAMEQLQGQIASAKIPMARIISKELYWVLSGDDFTLDINNPDEPKIFCLGNNPKRETIYGVANGLFNFRIVQIINEKGKQPCGVIVDELPTMYFDKIDRLIGTARSNKIAVCLGFQDYSQLEKDYGREDMNVIVNTTGNVFAGQVLGDSAEKLSKRFGKILQERQSVSINKQDTSTSISTQMDSLIPSGKIANLRQGTFVGSVAEDFGVEMTQNIFHAKILVDIKKRKEQEKQYQKIPIIKNFTNPKTGKDEMKKIIEANYYQIKNDVTQIVADELQRIADDPKLAHLLPKQDE